MALIYASAVNKRMNAPRQKRSLGEEQNSMTTSFSSHCRQRSNEDKNFNGHTNCAFFDSSSRECNHRKRSTSQNSCSNSSCCQTPPPNSILDSDHEISVRRGGLIQQSLHQNVNRSKTLGDVTRKFTVVHTNTSTKPPPRKISSPLMSQSVIYEPSFKLYASVKHDLNLKKDSSSKKDLRKVMAKKRMAKENSAHREEELVRLAVSDGSDDHSEEEEPLDSKTKKKNHRSACDVSTKSQSPEKRNPDSKQNAFRRMCDRLQKWKLNTHA